MLSEISEFLTEPLRVNGDAVILLASGSGDKTIGGLYAWDGREIECIDTLSTSGMTLHDRRLARILITDGSPGGELLVYDRHGIQSYARLDFLFAAHDIAWDGECYLIVSSGNNTVYRVDPTGRIVSERKLPGEGDSWHVNCLAFGESGILACAFGAFSRNHEWYGHLQDGSGLVFDLQSGRKLINNLNAPHHPRYFDGAWAVCNSGSSELLHVDAPSGKVLRTAKLNAWTRGIALSDDYIFVGESDRCGESGKKAAIAILDRRTWEVLGRIPVKCDEIYDLLLAPPDTIEGLRAGFRTNARRQAEQTQYQLFREAGVEPDILWAISDPLPVEACKIAITCNIPPVMKPGALLRLDCTVKNNGHRIFVSAPPWPVRLACQWKGAAPDNADFYMESDRTPLSRPLPPGETQRASVVIRVPGQTGKYLFILTMVQEHRAWFHDLDSTSAIQTEVFVTAE